MNGINSGLRTNENGNRAIVISLRHNKGEHIYLSEYAPKIPHLASNVLKNCVEPNLEILLMFSA